MLSLSNVRSLSKVEILLNIIQDLSMATTLADVTQIVRSAARELVGSDGATFILKEGANCFYADEDALSPLWKGRRFPQSACISGWVMQNKQAAVVSDIYADSRIPVDAYKPTFVKSLAVVPIRTKDPIGAIGTYWAHHHQATAEQVQLLQALADSASVAVEKSLLLEGLENKIRERTDELESFSYSVSHDLKAPIRSILGFTKIIEEDFEKQISDVASSHLNKVYASAQQMYRLIDALLDLARITRLEIQMVEVNLSRIAENVIQVLRTEEPDRNVDVIIQKGISVIGDERLLRIAIDNLFRNAWKFSQKTEHPKIEFGASSTGQSGVTCFIKDNGSGFDMRFAQNLFKPFHRLHSTDDFSGSGIGLATVQRIISRHNGRIWAESKVGEGAQFYFEIPLRPSIL